MMRQAFPAFVVTSLLLFGGMSPHARFDSVSVAQPPLSWRELLNVCGASPRLDEDMSHAEWRIIDLLPETCPCP